MVDGVYIGPYDIGINCCSMKRKILDSDSDFPFTIRSIGKDKDSLVLDVPLGEWSEKEEECWPSIRGKEISYICNYESEGKNIELISLDDLRKERFPHLDAPAIYTINKFWRTRQTLWSAVQMLTQKLCCQTIHDCPKVVPLHYESE